MRYVRKIGLLARFSVLSLVLIAALGVGLAYILRSQIRANALGNAQGSAQRIAELGIRPQLEPRDLKRGLSAKRARKLRRAVGPTIRSGELRDLRIWNRDARVIWARDRALIGKKLEADEGLRSALRGRAKSHAEGEEEGEHGSAGGGGGLLEVYVPLRFSTARPPAGAFEIYLPYAPVAASIRDDTRNLYLALLGGLVLLYLGLFRIVASASRRLRRQADENRHQALHDALTELPNRMLFNDRVGKAVRVARRDRSGGAVLLMDLDRFKEINDTLGHQKGDALLREVGNRLHETMRESDTVARLGGDEFAVLLPSVSDAAAAGEAAERIFACLEQDFVIDEIPVDLDASIGIALYPLHGDEVNTLLQRADVAMYEAKRSHGGHEIYSPEKDPYSPVRLAMVGELRRALRNKELLLHYQPKIDVASNEVHGVEALVRWQHPEHGLLPPSEFIPMAEHTGLIRPLTEYVLSAALGQCRQWQEAGLDLTVSVNLSTRSLLDPNLPDIVTRLLASRAVPPSLLELEITESTIMMDPDHAIDVLRRLDAMGVALSIDDFGTGHSSLAYLRQLPVKELKIDRTFVANMTSNPGDAFIVRSAIDLSHHLGLRVVAEGVEDQDTLVALADLECNLAQGYQISRPVAAEELEQWLGGRVVPAVSAHRVA
jgi:diguanylate cyclase (GGDEF)-like protein